MTLFGLVLDADAAVTHGLALAKADDVVSAAIELAQPAAKAPRDLVVATKKTLRTTAAYDRHGDAVETELVAQVASMETPAFAELLAAMRARISRQA
jgi:enoyl-CoA hydratase